MSCMIKITDKTKPCPYCEGKTECIAYPLSIGGIGYVVHKGLDRCPVSHKTVICTYENRVENKPLEEIANITITNYNEAWMSQYGSELIEVSE